MHNPELTTNEKTLYYLWIPIVMAIFLETLFYHFDHPEDNQIQ